MQAMLDIGDPVPLHFINTCRSEYGTNIKYCTARNALLFLKENSLEDEMNSFKYMTSFMDRVKELNPGSFVIANFNG